MKLENSICMLIHGVKCYVLSLDHIIYWHLDVATIVQYLFFKSQLLQLVRQTKIINLVPLALLATTCQNSQEPIKSRSNFKAKCRFGSFLHVTAVASMRRTEALASVKFYQILSIFIFFIRLIILDFIRLISYNGPCVHLGCSFFLATALHVGLHRIGGRSRPSYLFRKGFLFNGNGFLDSALDGVVRQLHSLAKPPGPFACPQIKEHKSPNILPFPSITRPQVTTSTHTM